MRKRISPLMRLSAWLCALLLCAIPLSAGYAAGISVSEAQCLADDILTYKQNQAKEKTVQAMLDGSLTQTAGVGGEWFVFSLIQYGKKADYSGFCKKIKAVLNNGTEKNAVVREKYALILLSCGYDEPLLAQTLENSAGKLGIMSDIFALHLLNNGVTGKSVSVDSVTEKLLSAVLPDGGWALNGSYADVDVTAMVIQALAPRLQDAAVKNAVNKAVELLSRKMLDSGGFASYGAENCESAAQVVIALAALGVDCTSDKRFMKGGKTLIDVIGQYKTADGGYRHLPTGEVNDNATAQALSAYVSLYRLKNGLDGYYQLKTPAKRSGSATQSTTSAATQEPAAPRQSATAKTDPAAKKSRPKKSSSKKSGSAAAATTTATTATTAATAANDRSSTGKGFSLSGLFAGLGDQSKKSTAANTTAVSAATSAPETAAVSSPPEQILTSGAYAPSTAVPSASEQAQTQPSATQAQDTTGESSTAPVSSLTQPVTETETAKAESAAFQAETTVPAAIAAPQGEQPTEQTASTAPVRKSAEEKGDRRTAKSSVKLYIAIITVAVAVAVALILRSTGRGGKLTYAVIAVCAAVVLLLTFTVHIQSRNSFYTEASPLTDGLHTTLTIRCDAAVGKSDNAPADGVILPKTDITVAQGSTVYDVFVAAAKSHSLHFEDASQTLNDHSTAYISGIEYLYEFDCGDLSGWIYRVNGTRCSVGCGTMAVAEGDDIEFLYTCNLGDDLA